MVPLSPHAHALALFLRKPERVALGRLREVGKRDVDVWRGIMRRCTAISVS